jgi:hypothetical protein
MPLPLVYKEKVPRPDVVNTIIYMEILIPGCKIKQLIAAGGIDIHWQSNVL